MSEENIVEKGNDTPIADSSIDANRSAVEGRQANDSLHPSEQQSLPKWRLMVLGLGQVAQLWIHDHGLTCGQRLYRIIPQFPRHFDSGHKPRCHQY